MENSTHNLYNLIEQLYDALQGEQISSAQRQEAWELIEENELEAADAAPSWLLELIQSVVQRRLTEGWIDFTRSTEIDDSNVLDFIREMQHILPVTYENNEESWLLTFPNIGLEACISLEGSCYKVSAIGETWEE